MNRTNKKLVNTKLGLFKTSLLSTSLTAIMAVGLTACGGGGGASPKASPSTPNPSKPSVGVPDPSNPSNPTTSTFSESATWKLNGMADGETCYDFDSKKEVGCTGISWDIKYKKKGYSISLWTNSGTSGEGNGGTLQGLRNWNELKSYPNAVKINGMDMSRYYKMDSAESVFGQNKWYEYNLKGEHQLYPNYKVFLITTDSNNPSTASSVQTPVYAMQVINYYSKAGKSGHQTLRWIDTAMPNKVKTVTFDSSDYKKWVYVDLKTGKTSTKDGNWQVALKRMDIKLNGGDSGTGKVAGFMALQPAGFYDADDKPVVDKFATDNAKSTLTALTDTSAYKLDKIKWVSDGFSSPLNPSPKGKYPNLDLGWYTYDMKTHKLSAKPQDKAEGALIRSGEGNSYARMWLKDINASTGEWTFEMDIQPAS